MHRGENSDFSRSPPGTKAALPRRAHTRNQRTGTPPELERRNPFRSVVFAVQEEMVLKLLYHKRPSSEVLQLKLASLVLRPNLFAQPNKTLNLVQWVRWIWGITRSLPSGWVPSPSINLPLLWTLTFWVLASQSIGHTDFGSVRNRTRLNKYQYFPTSQTPNTETNMRENADGEKGYRRIVLIRWNWGSYLWFHYYSSYFL